MTLLDSSLESVDIQVRGVKVSAKSVTFGRWELSVT